jgi:hypothetical protein
VTLASGDNYKGMLAAGLFHGKGVLTYSNGDAYDGEYTNGLPTGKGKMLFASSKIVMNRNMQNGVDRANTRELKDNTFSLTKKKKKNVKVHAGQYRQRGTGGVNPNSGVMGSILGNLGLGKGKAMAKGKGRTTKSKAKRSTIKAAREEGAGRGRTKAKKSTKRVSKKKTTTKKAIKIKKMKATKKKTSRSKTAAKSTIRKAIKKTKATKVIKPKRRKPRKPRTPSIPDPNYASVYRTSVCGTTRRKREGLNLDEIFNDDNVDLRRSKTMLRTIQEAERYLRNKYDDNGSMAAE